MCVHVERVLNGFGLNVARIFEQKLQLYFGFKSVILQMSEALIKARRKSTSVKLPVLYSNVRKKPVKAHARAAHTAVLFCNWHGVPLTCERYLRIILISSVLYQEIQ